LPPVAKALRDGGCELRGCERTVALLGADVKAATEDDWGYEYLDRILAVRIVRGLEAIK
jgi:glutamate-5-semialdehyde dehydrogenase